MSELFDVEMKDLKNLIKFYKKAPKRFNKVSAAVLNDFVFGTRKKNINILKSNLTIRNEKFLNSRIRVQKARKTQDVRSQEAIVGSIKTQRFSGWVEQETGKARKQTRTATLLARGGSKNKPMKPSARLKRSNQFRDPDEFPGSSGHNRSVAMIRMLAKAKWRKPFVIKGHSRIKSGLFKFRRKKLERLQLFKPFPSKLQPERLKWLRGGAKAFFKSNQVRDIWGKNLNRELLKNKKGKLR